MRKYYKNNKMLFFIRRYQTNNKEKIIQYSKEYMKKYVKTDTYKRNSKIYSKRYRETNKEKQKQGKDCRMVKAILYKNKGT